MMLRKRQLDRGRPGRPRTILSFIFTFLCNTRHMSLPKRLVLSQASMLHELWKNGELCDVKIKGLGDHQPIPCHAIILSSASHYFKALFVGAGASMQPSSPCYQVPLPQESLSLAVEAIYSQTIHFVPEKLDSWLSLASYLGIESILSRLGDEMTSSDQLSIQAAIPLLSLASRYDLPVKSALRRFSQSKLGLILNQPYPDEEEQWEGEGEGSFAVLSPLLKDDLVELLSADDLCVEESDVLQAVIDWCVYQTTRGQGVTSDLLEEHLTLVRREGLSESDPGAILALLKVKTPAHVEALVTLETLLSSQPSPSSEGPSCHLEGSRAGGALTSGRRRQAATMLLAAGGHDGDWRSLRSVECYDPGDDSWHQGPNLIQPTSFAGCAVLNKEAYFIGGTPLSTVVSKLVARGEQSQRASLDLPISARAHPASPFPSTSYSPPSSPPMSSYLGSYPGSQRGTYCQWEACPNLVVPRAHAGVVSCPDALLVIGGRGGQTILVTCEVFRSSVDSWQKSSWQQLPDLRTERSALATASLSGKVFAIGGQSNKQTMATMEIFDLGSEKWLSCDHKLALGCRKYAAACTLNGRIYLVGGVNEKRARLSSIEAYDPREGSWRQVADMASPRSSCGVSSLGDRIYIVGGQASDADRGGASSSVGSLGGMGMGMGGSGGGTSVHSSVECLEGAAGFQLRQCAHLSVGRSGLGLCSI